MNATNSTGPCMLDCVADFQPCRIVEIHAPEAAPEWRDWLRELGFLPGEEVTLVGRARPGGDPVVARVANSTFALRLAEAACVAVVPLPGIETTQA